MGARRLRQLRTARGWTQSQLAGRAGVSRPEVSGIETGRLVPGVHAALALARALDTTVESLFAAEPLPGWAAPPRTLPVRAWVADVGGRRLVYPCEANGAWVESHDVVVSEAEPLRLEAPERTLVVAGCDPAVGLLRAAMRARGVRVLALGRSSTDALDLLRKGLVHVAGVHLAEGSTGTNLRAVQRRVGAGFRLRRWASWEVGVVTGPGVRLRSLDAKRLGRLSWVGRDAGSGARRCLDALLGDGRPPRFAAMASDHHDVVRALAMGIGDAGIAVRVAAEEGAQAFLPLRTEPYDLCYSAALEQDGVLSELVAALESDSLGRHLSEVPGYDARRIGTVAETR